MRRLSLIAALVLSLGCGDGSQPESQAPLAVTESERATEPASRAAGPARFPPQPHARIAHRSRSAYYGELHVHTRHSMDAYAWDVRATPDDAYRFARGEPIQLPPLDAEGEGARTFQPRAPARTLLR